MKSVAIGIPSGDMVHADFMVSLSQMLMYSTMATIRDRKFKITHLIPGKSSQIQKGRHEIVEGAKNANVDYLLMLDTDMTFPHTTLETLIGCEKFIVGCNYLTRRIPFRSTALTMDMNPLPHNPQGLIKVGRVGTGVILVHMDVFKRLGLPHFNIYWDGQKFIGEDHDFCRRAIDEGFEVWCHTDLSTKVAHLGQMSCFLGEEKA